MDSGFRVNQAMRALRSSLLCLSFNKFQLDSQTT